MTCLVQVAPPSDEMPSNSPLTTAGRVDMVTMFCGFVGLMAMASSASLPGMALASKFGGIGGEAAPAGMAIASATANATTVADELVRIRSLGPRMVCLLATRYGGGRFYWSCGSSVQRSAWAFRARAPGWEEAGRAARLDFPARWHSVTRSSRRGSVA